MAKKGGTNETVTLILIGLLIIAAVVVVFLFGRIMLNVLLAKEEVTGTFAIFAERIKAGDLSSLLNPLNWPQLYRDWEQSMIERATTTQFDTRVDERFDERLGLTLSRLTPTAETVDASTDVTVFTDIEGRILDREIVVDVACASREGVLADAYNPSDVLVFDTSDSKSVDCVFSAGSLRAGTHTIEMKVSYNFNTVVDFLGLFVEKENMRAIQKETGEVNAERAFFSKYRIDEPEGIVTPGPVEVDMGITGKPVVVDAANPRQYTLQINLENRDKGVLKQVERMSLVIPKGFRVEGVSEAEAAPEEGDCSSLQRGELQEVCNDDLHRVYQVRMKPFATEVKRVKPYLVYFRPLAMSEVLRANEPYSRHIFKAEVEYAYEIAEKAVVRVMENSEKSSGTQVKP